MMKSSRERPVSTMTFGRAHSSMRPSSSSAMKPSLRGMITSITSTSGPCSRTASRMAAPSDTAATSSISGLPDKKSDKRRSMLWLSSASITRIFSINFIPFPSASGVYVFIRGENYVA